MGNIKMNGGLLMQILKQELKDKIRIEAKKAFLMNGFEKASMRGIAKESGTTVGNVYRYFKNKDALYLEVVNEAYDAIMHIMNVNHSKNIDFNRTDSVRPDYDIVIDPVLNSIVDVFITYRQEIRILMACSEGSKFESVRKKFGVMVVDKIYNEIFADIDNRYMDLKVLSTSLANTCIDGITRVCNSDMSDEEMHRNIYGLMVYLFHGAHTRLSIIEERVKGEINE